MLRMIRNGRVLVLLALLLLVLTVTPTVFAQSQDFCGAGTNVPFVEYGDTVSNEITDDSFFLPFCFEGNEGDEVVITMTTTSGDLRPLVGLADSRIEEIFVQNTGRNEASVEFTLPEDANFLIISTRDGLDSGTTEGEFELTLELASGSATGGGDEGDDGKEDGGSSGSAAGACDDVDADGVIAYGDTAGGEITDDDFTDIYCFEGLEGDEIVISATATDGDLDTLLLLTDSGLEEALADNDDIERGNTNSQIEFTLPTDGAFVIIVTRYNLEDGRTEGEYELTLELLGGPSADAGDDAGGDDGKEDGGSSGSAAGACDDVELSGIEIEIIAYGDTVEDTVDDDTPVRVYCFEGAAGDQVTISMEATSGNLDTLLILADPEVTETFAQNDDIRSGNTNSEIVFELPDDGAYLIFATRYQIADGSSEGRFSLTLDGR